MEVFYATIVACWAYTGCVFGVSPTTYDEPTCGMAETEIYAELAPLGMPAMWNYACLTADGVAALRGKYNVPAEEGEI